MREPHFPCHAYSMLHFVHSTSHFRVDGYALMLVVLRTLELGREAGREWSNFGTGWPPAKPDGLHQSKKLFWIGSAAPHAPLLRQC